MTRRLPTKSSDKNIICNLIIYGCMPCCSEPVSNSKQGLECLIFKKNCMKWLFFTVIY